MSVNQSIQRAPAKVRTNPLDGFVFKTFVCIWMVGVFVAAFIYAPPALDFRNEALARMLFFHVPNTIVGLAVSLLSAVYAILYLVRRRWIDDSRSYCLAVQAGLFWLLTTVTGAEFAKVQWGAYWSWDPKQAAIFLLLLAYLGYFTLRSSLSDLDVRARMSAGYMIVAALITPLLTYVLPNMSADSLHPKGVIFSSDGLDLRYKLIFWSATIGLSGLSVWIYQLQMRVEKISRAIDVRLSGNDLG